MKGRRGLDVLLLFLVAGFHFLMYARIDRGFAHGVIGASFASAGGVRVLTAFVTIPETDLTHVNQLTMSALLIGAPTALHVCGASVHTERELEFAFCVLAFALVNCVMTLQQDVPSYFRRSLVAGHVLVIPSIRPPGTIAPGVASIMLLGAMAIGQVGASLVMAWIATITENAGGASPRRGSGGSDSPRRRTGDSGSEKERTEALLAMCKSLVAGEAQLLDVREQHEFAQGVLGGAVLYPLSSMTQGEPPPPAFDAARSTYIYCARGIRVHTAISILTTMGYAEDHLHPLPEGFTALVAFGVNKAPTAEARKLLRLVIPPKPANAEGTLRSVRSFDPDTYSLFRALQTSRDYASYEKVRLLGRGTQGTAVLLRAPPGSVPEGRVSEVVAKCVSVSDELPDKELKRIEAEVKLLRKLRHKNVISYVGAFFSSGLISILTEYASGGALHSHIVTAGRTNAPFATDRIRRWIGELAEGLHFIHGEGVLHRDLSPKNLLVGNADEILIADFGWSTVIGAQVNGSQHLATTFAGTPCARLRRSNPRPA